jgi:hypothetical protein
VRPPDPAEDPLCAAAPDTPLNWCVSAQWILGVRVSGRS